MNSGLTIVFRSQNLVYPGSVILVVTARDNYRESRHNVELRELLKVQMKTPLFELERLIFPVEKLARHYIEGWKGIYMLLDKKPCSTGWRTGMNVLHVCKPTLDGLTNQERRRSASARLLLSLVQQ